MARCLVAASSNLQFNKVTRSSLAVTRVSRLIAVAVVLSLAPAFAADSADTKAKSNGKGEVTGDKAQSDFAHIPECFEKLNLTAKQQDQIREIVRDYDQSINSAWNQYRERYMQTIVAETSLLAAVEDGLTDAQRQQIRNHRRKTAQHKKTTVAVEDKSNQSKEKSVDANVEAAGVSLTKEQEAAADKVHQSYRMHLRTLNRDIHALHNRLLSLEADKLAEIETVLTKDQLLELRANRQNAPETVKITIGRHEATKTE